MTAQNDLDRTLGAWFGAEAAPAVPPEPLARVIKTTGAVRPRPSLLAGFGSHWVSGSTSGVLGGAANLRPAAVIAVVALLVMTAVGALLIGSRLLAPPTPPLRHTYVNELVAAPDLAKPMLRPVLARLGDDRVLAIDASVDGTTKTQAQIYDPATGVSVAAGPMLSADRLYVTSALRLKDGRVLVIGDTANQIFDPTTMRFAPVGPPVTPRSGALTALLDDGRVLIAGGNSPVDGGSVGTAELFDPGTLTFSATGSPATVSPRGLATLPDGRVFMAASPGNNFELYNPTTGTFSADTAASSNSGDPVVLPNGQVVMIGSTGMYDGGTIESWDPASHAAWWISLPEPLTDATVLDDGRILLIGMCRGRETGWTGLYDPATGVTTPGPTTSACRPSSTRLADGRVLIAGGDIGDLDAGSTVQIFR